MVGGFGQVSYAESETPMKLDLQGKRALACGGSEGIGQACAEAFARSGAAVTLVARSEERLREVAARLSTTHGQQHGTLAVDFSEPETLRAKIAEELQKVSLTLQMKVGEDEKLFGAVTSQMISEALEEKKITIDKRQIELEEPIKALGIYDVPIKLHQSVTAKVKVWVVRE